MKRLGLLLMACTLVLGMSQCKKTEIINTNDNLGGVRITLIFDNGSNSKAIVDPTGNNGEFPYAPVSYENGDRIFVGYNNAYVGYLDYADGSFSGTVDIETPVGEQPLHFYLLGGKGFTPVQDGNTFTVNISDQTTNYPVISYATSKQNYTGEGSYTAKLVNYCSIVKFTTTDLPVTNTISLFGMNNQVEVNLNPANEDERFTFSKDGDGEMKLHAESSTERWGILLPQDEVTNTCAFATDYATQDPIRVPQIEANQYNSDGITLNLSHTLISVSATTKVRFAPGNLQYLGNAGGSGTWRFAENQYDFFGDGPTSATDYQGNVTVAGYTKYNTSADMDVARDLFGWGTSGFNGYNPYMTSNNSNSYYSGSLTDTDYDWGVFHRASGNSSEKITNGGNYSWRLFTSEEWSYAVSREGRVYTRPDVPTYSENKKLFTAATVMGAKGIIIFPDTWNGSFDRTIKYGNASGVNFSTNTYDNADNWALFERLGCVFLPAAHYRNGISLGTTYDGGRYWSGTIQGSRGGCLEFSDKGTITLSSTTNEVRYLGQSVRLIRIVE